VIGAALDSTAGLVKLIAMLHFEGRDEELAELVHAELQFSMKGSGKTTLQKLKENIDNGTGIGMPIIMSIMRNRRRLAGEADADANDQRGLIAIREAVKIALALKLIVAQMRSRSAVRLRITIASTAPRAREVTSELSSHATERSALANSVLAASRSCSLNCPSIIDQASENAWDTVLSVSGPKADPSRRTGVFMTGFWR
jgi:hypothetical protein